MKRLSSSLLFFVLFALLCFRTDAAVLEISTEETLVAVGNIMKIKVSASDLPDVTTSLQGSISWDRDLVTLIDTNLMGLANVLLNTATPERIGFSWFKASGQEFIGTQDILTLTFKVGLEVADETKVFFSFDTSPTPLEVTNQFFISQNLETIETFITVDGPLPVELATFTASPRDNSISLNWATASEINFDGFEVERSVNGNNFTAISSLNARGNETEGSTYGYSDEAVTLGKTYYYRLKMNDLDGSVEYSNILSTKINSQRPVVEVYPNPAFGEAIIAFENFLLIPTPSVITVYDNMGCMVQRRHQQSTVGMNKIHINVDDLSSGLYTINLEQGEYQVTQKLIVQ